MLRGSNILTYQNDAIVTRINLDDNGARVELLHCLGVFLLSLVVSKLPQREFFFRRKALT